MNTALNLDTILNLIPMLAPFFGLAILIGAVQAIHEALDRKRTTRTNESSKKSKKAAAKATLSEDQDVLVRLLKRDALAACKETPLASQVFALKRGTLRVQIGERYSLYRINRNRVRWSLYEQDRLVSEATLFEVNLTVHQMYQIAAREFGSQLAVR